MVLTFGLRVRDLPMHATRRQAWLEARGSNAPRSDNAAQGRHTRGHAGMDGARSTARLGGIAARSGQHMHLDGTMLCDGRAMLSGPHSSHRPPMNSSAHSPRHLRYADDARRHAGQSTRPGLRTACARRTRVAAVGIALLGVFLHPSVVFGEAPEEVSPESHQRHTIVLVDDEGEARQRDNVPRRLNDTYDETDAILFLARKYRNGRRFNSYVQIGAGSALTLGGLVALTGVDPSVGNFELRAYAVTFLLVGPPMLTTGLMTFFGPITDGEIEATALAREGPSDAYAARRFLERRARVARRTRHLRGLSLIFSGIATLAVSTSGDDTIGGTGIRISHLVASGLGAFGTITLGFPSVEERLYNRSLTWGPPRARGIYVAPLLFSPTARGISFGAFF